MIRIPSARVRALVLVFLAMSAAPAARAQGSSPGALSYEDCARVVEALVGSRYEREDGPISEFLVSAAHAVEAATRGPVGWAAPGCPDGFSGDRWNGQPACFALGSRFAKHPNVMFFALEEPEVRHRPDGSVEACVTARWLIWSFGEQSRELCATGRERLGAWVVDGPDVSLASRAEFVGAKVREACGDAPPESQVCE